MLADLLSSLLDLVSDIAAAVWRRPRLRRVAGIVLLCLAVWLVVAIWF